MLWVTPPGLYGLTENRDHGNGSPQRAPPGLTDFFFLMSTRTVKALRSPTTPQPFHLLKPQNLPTEDSPQRLEMGGGHKHGEGVLKKSFLQWKPSVFKSLCV